MPGIVFGLGNISDIPLAGDWNGDGVDTVGVYRPPNATFYLTNSPAQRPSDLVLYVEVDATAGLDVHGAPARWLTADA